MKIKFDLTQEYLWHHYVILDKSVRQISMETGCARHTIVRNLQRFDIPIIRGQAKKRGKPYPTKRRGCGEISGSYWCMLRYHAKSRNLPLQITIKEAGQLFLDQNRRCALSGIDLKFAPIWGFPARLLQTASLDRIDSNEGYVMNNVQWIHKDLNTMKMDLDQEEFVEWCRLIAIYHGVCS